MKKTLGYWCDELAILQDTCDCLLKLYDKSSEDDQKFIDIAMRCVLIRRSKIKNCEVDPYVGFID